MCMIIDVKLNLSGGFCGNIYIYFSTHSIAEKRLFFSEIKIVSCVIQLPIISANLVQQ